MVKTKQRTPQQLAARRARNARRRNLKRSGLTGQPTVNKPKAATKMARTARTHQQVENDLRTLRIIPKEGSSDWASCRLHPWDRMSTMGMLPDGSSDPRVVTDLYSYTDISGLGPGVSFQLITFPALPFTALFNPLSTIAAVQLSSTWSIAGPPAGVPGATAVGNCAYNGAVSAGPVPINFTNSGYTTFYNDDPTVVARLKYMNADKCRIISQAWRLVYTGNAANCAGLVTVTTSPITRDPTVTKMSGTISTISPGGTTSPGLSTTNGLTVIPVDLTFGTYGGKDSVALRPETSPRGICRRHNATFPFKEVFGTQPIMVQNTTAVNVPTGTVGAALACGYSGAVAGFPATCTLGSLQMFDDDWDSTVITLQSVTGSFRFETWTCVEWLPVPASTVYQFAQKPPPANLNILSKVETKVANQPTAMPGGSSTNN